MEGERHSPPGISPRLFLLLLLPAAAVGHKKKYLLVQLEDGSDPTAGAPAHASAVQVRFSLFAKKESSWK